MGTTVETTTVETPGETIISESTTVETTVEFQVKQSVFLFITNTKSNFYLGFDLHQHRGFGIRNHRIGGVQHALRGFTTKSDACVKKTRIPEGASRRSS